MGNSKETICGELLYKLMIYEKINFRVEGRWKVSEQKELLKYLSVMKRLVQLIELKNDITIEEINGVGRIEIAGNNKKMIDDAMRLIKGIVAVPEIGEVYQGKVRSIMPYGAFVEFLPGKDGLLHISEIDWKRLETIEEAGLKEGDDIEVKLLDIDSKTGKFKLSHKVLLPKPEGMGEGNHAKRERKPQQNKEQK